MMNQHEYTVRRTSDLIPYVSNSRTHSQDQISQVAASIKEFGFTNPVLIDDQCGIIAGHGRVMAAKKLGIEEVPCIVLVGLTDAQKKAYVIADNQLALNAGWDLDMLKLEIESLQDMDFDIDLLGFDGDFISGVIDGEISDSDSDHDDDNPYTDKVDGLYYEPTGESVKPEDAINSEKVTMLVSRIDASGIAEEYKQLLRAAATRHYCFNYSKMAEIYANAEPELQDLMEQSALVIVDYDRAIDLGYAKIREVLKDDLK